MTQPGSMSHSEYTVAWICALPHEMTAARAMLDTIHDQLPQSATDSNTYLLGEISGHKIVVTCLPAGVYGTTAAASGVSQMRSTFPNIRVGLLVGIGGGVPAHNIRLGDVAVSTPTRMSSGVVQYDFGKATAGGSFERIGSLNRAPDFVLTAVARLQAEYLAGHGHISHIISDILGKKPQLRSRYSRPVSEEDQLFDAAYDHASLDDPTCMKCDRSRLLARIPRPSDGPQIHHGLIASGNMVIKDGYTRDRLAHSLGNICFEMEAAGIMNIIPTLVIRGICDYSDSHKNDTWQGYAALSAAAYAKKLLSIIPTGQTAMFNAESMEVACRGSGGVERTQNSPSQNQDVGEVKIATYYKLLGSRLSMDITEVNLTSVRRKTKDSTLGKYKITFLPPSWLSNTLLRINVDKYVEHLYANPVLEWSIRPLTINQSPWLRKALALCDIQQLKDLFQANEARPTDMVFDENLNEPIPLLEALLEEFTSYVPCSWKLSRHRLIFQFLLDQKQRPSARAIVGFFLSANDHWVYDQRQIYQNLLDNYLHSTLAVGDCSLESVKIPSRLFIPKGCWSRRYGDWDGEFDSSILCAVIEQVSGFQAVYTCLFHQSLIWSIEDLTMRSVWYIGILAYTDATFCGALKDYFASFRSPFNTTLKRENAMLQFEIGRIVEQVKSSAIEERFVFLQTIIRRGTRQMLIPFLNVGIDLDEGGLMENYLGLAAKLGKMPFVTSLLDAGASTARALSLLCDSHSQELTSTKFNQLFATFIDSLTDVKGQLDEHDGSDPIVAVLQCNRTIRSDAVESLLKKGIFLPSNLYGSQDTFVARSYILNALLYNHPSTLEIFFNHGIPSDVNIQDIFRTDTEWYQSVGSYTWLTLAVELGKTDCVKVLVGKSSNPIDLLTRQDAGGRCALSLAQSLTTVSHPRTSILYRLHWIEPPRHEGDNEVSSSDDAAIVDVLRAALGTGIEDLEAVDNSGSAKNSKHLHLEMGDSRPDPDREIPWETSRLHKALYVGLCFIGMYGVLIGYSFLRLAFSVRAQHMSRAVLVLCIAIPLGLVGSYYRS